MILQASFGTQEFISLKYIVIILKRGFLFQRIGLSSCSAAVFLRSGDSLSRDETSRGFNSTSLIFTTLCIAFLERDATVQARQVFLLDQ